MAVSTIERPLTVKTKTVTGIADNNGFLNTGLESNSSALINASSLKIDGTSIYAFFTEVLSRGGTPAIYIALRFKNWEGTVQGKNSTIEATIQYIDF